MQKLALRLLLLLSIVLSGSIFAYAGDLTPKKGVIRVKLQPEVAAQVGNTSRVKSVGDLSTGVRTLDVSAKAIKAVSMRRVFPYAPKFEAQRAKYGLDRWYEITFDESVATEEAISVFKKTAGVQVAHGIVPMELKENATFRKVTAAPKASATDMPFNDPRLSQQWHYYNDGSLAQSKAGADINLFEAWKTTAGNSKVTVAIIDGGIDLNHEDLAANICMNEAELNGTEGVDDDGNGYIDDIYGWNFCTNSATIYPHDHGTHVAGTVAAVNNNGIGVCGVAGGDGTADSGVKLLSVQVFDSRSGTGEGDFANAIIYAAERGATIAQCSWGWGSADYVEQDVLDAIDYFTDMAYSDNMLGGLCIFATGNSGETGNWYPGCYEKVLSVAAMCDDLTPASYSNYGEWVDVIAPGGLMDYGDAHGVLSTLPNDSYGFSEGTSMATPHVSGIAALVLSKHGKDGFLNETLRQQIVTSVKDFYSSNPKYEGLYGSGYVDAAKALEMGDGSAPAAVAAITTYPGQDNIALEWTIPASSDNVVNNHILYYSTTAFDATSDLSTLSTKIIDTKFLSSGDVTTYELTGLSPLTTYYIALKAVNRWGDASELSPVVTATTNAGPKMTLSKTSLSMTIDASKTDLGSTLFNIGNDDEGLLKWSASIVTTGATATKTLYSLNNGAPSAGMKPASKPNVKITPYATTSSGMVTSDYVATDYPRNFAYFNETWASIGEEDKSLPNSMAQWFYVDESKYPDGFNLTNVQIWSLNGQKPTVQVYKGGSIINSANLLQEVSVSYFYSNQQVALPEHIYFAPGESFWIVVHFPAESNSTVYPLGIAKVDETYATYSYMSNDLGKTWMLLADALKGGSYESIASNVGWAVTAVSKNPDWSQVFTLSPSSGTVKQGETQEVTIANDGQKIVNGTYKFKVKFETNESEENTKTVTVTLNVKGNQAEMAPAKVVDFGSLLVGESKTLTVEVFNEGYGPFVKGSSLSSPSTIVYSNSQFTGPTYIQNGFQARSYSTIDLTYTPTEAGNHSGNVTFTDKYGNEFKVYMQGVATDPAKITIDPTEVEVGDLEVGGESVTKEFTITNDGKYPLEYVFPKFSDKTIEGNSSKVHKFGYTALSNLNGATGFAYDGNPELFNTTDITSTFTDDVTYTGAIALGFDFPFYGKTYDQIHINSLGGLAFSIGEYSYFPPLSESSTSIQGIGYISAYGHQLQFGPNSKVVYAKQDGKFVVKYENVLAVKYGEETYPISFRIMLSANGDIEVFYDEYDLWNLFQDGSTLFCAIKDPESADPLVITSADVADYWSTNPDDPAGYVYLQFANQCSVKFVAPKPNMVQSLSSPYGMLGPGESVTISAVLAADDTMYAGETFNNIVVMSNDPENGTSVVKFTANITGADLLPKATLVSEVLDFGKVFRTSDSKDAVTVKNSGKSALTVNSVVIAGGKFTVDVATPFVIEAGMSKDIVVTIPTETEGAVEDVMTITTDAGELTVTLKGEVIGTPAVSLNFTEITETVESGVALSKDLTITNTGDEDLVVSVVAGTISSVYDENTDEGKVSYLYSAAIDDDNVKCEWIDIETTGLGEQNNFSYYNSHDYVAVELPFEFPFYGEKYTKMYIYNTGFVSFTEREDQKIWPEPPAVFPGGSIYTNIIAPYWGLHTMDTSKTAGTYHYMTDEQVVVSWMEYGNTMNIGVCYQLIMKKDGSFKFQYKSYGDYAIIYGSFGLAGMANEDGSQSLLLPDRMIQFGNAVQFTPVIESTLAPEASKTVTVNVETDKMAGVYNDVITVNTNVPHSEVVEIPVTLTITGEAKPVFPTEIIVERVVGTNEVTRDDLPDGGVTFMGANYEAAIKIENQGTATFTITNVVNGGPSIYDDWFDMYTPIFQTWYYAPALDWITGEPTGSYSWSQYYDYTPVTVDNNGVIFSVPMMNEYANTPGEYDVPMTFYYNDGDSAVVNVRFIVTEAPIATLDKSEIRVEGAAPDYKGTEKLTLSNTGKYKLTYDLKIDLTGVGEEAETGGGGGIAPMAVAKELSAEQMTALKANLKSEIVPLEVADKDAELNIYDAPSDFEYNQILYYPSNAGSPSYSYGTGNTYGEYKAATYYVAPEGGFNISHVYIATTLTNTDGTKASNVDYKVEIVAGDDYENGTVLAKGSLHIDEMEGAKFVVMPLDKAVYMTEGQDFYVRVTYPVGLEWPAYMSVKEESVISNRYMGYVEGYGWFDVASMFKESYGSLGYIMSCIETVPGEPWVKILNETVSGTLAAPADGEDNTGSDDSGSDDSTGDGGIAIGPLSTTEDATATSVELELQLNAAFAPLVKGNKAMLVIKSNDPSASVINFPIYLDVNGAPTVSAPANTVYAKEAESTSVNIIVTDEDGDDMTLLFSDPSQLSKVKAVTATDADAVITTAEDGTITVAGAPSGVNVEVEITPAYGDEGKYTFTLTAIDTYANEGEAIVNYEVEHVNRAPEAANMSDVEILLDGVSPVIAFDNLFSDPDGDEMTYSVSLTKDDIVTAFTTANSVIFVGSKVGAVTVDVVATDVNGASSRCSFNVVVTEPSGIEDLSLNAKVEIYPNPVAETLYVTCDFSANDATYAIYAANGAKVYSSKGDAVQGEAKAINVAELAAGVYILQVTTEDGVATFHVVKK